MTNNKLTNRNYTPNRALKSLIEEFSRRQTSNTNLDEFLTFRILSGRSTRPDWQNRPTIRIIISLLGASGVGKTVLSQCLQYGRLPENCKHPPMTVGIDMQFYHLDRLFQNEYAVIIQLNDPPGQERFESATNHFFRQCHGVLLLADTTRIDTLERLDKHWYRKLEKLSMDHVQTMLVCTKIDLLENEPEDERQRFFQQAEQFTAKHQMPMVQVSAYRGDNVEHIFKQLIIRILSDTTLVDELISKANVRLNSPRQRSNRDVLAIDSHESENGKVKVSKRQSKCCK